MFAQVRNAVVLEGIPFYIVEEHSSGQRFNVNARFVSLDGENIPPTGFVNPQKARVGDSVLVASHAAHRIIR